MKLLDAARRLAARFAAAQAPDDGFCVEPFRNAYVLPNGEVKPCCVFEGAIRDGDRKMSIDADSVESIWNSVHMRDVRRRMVEGASVPECRYCFDQESRGLLSFRRFVNDAWSGGWRNPEASTLREVRASAAESGFRAPLETVDIVLSSTCNLKCRMCYADSSSAIAGDAVHSRWAPLSTSPFVGSEKALSWTVHKERILADLLKNPGRYKSVFLIGGETLMLRETREIMRYLIDSGANQSLSVVTNATIVSEEWCLLAERFKTIEISVSMDGYGSVNDYIRYPANWSSVEAGLKRLRRLGNAVVAVNTVVQAYNLLDLVPILRYCDEAGVLVYPSVLTEPAYLSSFIMPSPIRREAARRLRDYALTSRSTARDSLLALADAWDAAPECEPRLLHEFMVFTNDLDVSRGQKFNESLPELRDRLAVCGIVWARETRFAQAARTTEPIA